MPAVHTMLKLCCKYLFEEAFLISAYKLEYRISVSPVETEIKFSDQIHTSSF